MHDSHLNNRGQSNYRVIKKRNGLIQHSVSKMPRDLDCVTVFLIKCYFCVQTVCSMKLLGNLAWLCLR